MLLLSKYHDLPDTCILIVVVLVPIPDHLSAIMLPVLFVTLPGTCYTFCGGILFIYICILCIAYILFSVYLADITIVYAPHRMMVILHMPICMFISITSPLDNIFIISNWILLL